MAVAEQPQLLQPGKRQAEQALGAQQLLSLLTQRLMLRRRQLVRQAARPQLRKLGAEGWPVLLAAE